MAVSIALDIGGTNIKMALVRQGSILNSLMLPVKENTTLGPLLPLIEKNIDQLLDGRDDLQGIGLAFPCIVDNQKSLILSEYVKYQDINDLNLSQWAHDQWGVSVLFENDARAALVGEWQYGAGKGYDNLVQVTMGTGIGSAVLMNGRLLRGKHYLAGNLGGHMTIDYEGADCNCGNKGCLETVASTWALPDLVKISSKFADSTLSELEVIDFKALFDHAANNDELAISVRDHCIKAWGFGLINLVHAFDPEIIIISGGVTASKEIIFPIFRDMINKHTWLPPETIEILPAAFKDSAALFGLDYLIQNQNKI